MAVDKATGSLRPVQVVMDTGRFLVTPETQSGGGAPKDFFAGNDDGFATHKTSVQKSLLSFSETLSKTRKPVGFVHVELREQALAKSHRPLDRVFSRANRFVVVGGERDGQLIVQATPRALKEVAEKIDARVEASPAFKENEKGIMTPRVSRMRSEVGSIGGLRLHDQSDRLTFDAEQAISYLSNEGVFGSYIVELFRIDPSLLSPGAMNSTVAEFVDAINSIPGGLLVRPALPEGLNSQLWNPTYSISIKLINDSDLRSIELPRELLVDSFMGMSREYSIELFRGESDLNINRHGELLSTLAEQALVRSVHLPPIIDNQNPTESALECLEPLPSPEDKVVYPVLGVIDGGVEKVESLEPWVVGRLGLIPSSDASKSHGTRIAALAAGAGHLNPLIADVVEPVGVKVYDLDIFPRKDLRSQYYADYQEFLDQLEESIVRAKKEFGVRIFNFSVACGGAYSGQYSISAEGFDAISIKHNVLFVIAAGNLPHIDSRPPWSDDINAAVRMLAAQSGNQRILPPAEAFHAITVGALNPPGQIGHEAFLPTTYTRRGPGSGHSRKPDLSHVGGISYDASVKNTGLFSLDETGSTVGITGTSFAAPIVGASLATLDQRLLHKAAPELLRALLIHKAWRANSLRKRNISHIAQEFVGYGRPLTADSALSDGSSEITLVFNEVMPKGRVLEFDFSWPQCLVLDNGKCRGRATLTLVYLPPVDRNFGDESMRLELDVYLRQQNINKKTGEVSWQGRAIADGANVPNDIQKREKESLKRGVKWSPVKRLSVDMLKGRGNSSDWRIVVQPLTRRGIEFPESGVAFALLLSIADNDGVEPVYDEMRNQLVGLGVTLADIEVSTRVQQLI